MRAPRLLLGLLCVTLPWLACDTTDDTSPPTSLLWAFEAEGFVAQVGAATSFLVADCEDLERCFGNNATAPYMLYSVPSHPDHPDALTDSTIGEIPKVPEGMTAAQHLAASEAIVLVGQTPPSANYFGFTHYLYSRVNSAGDRIPVFASLGDSINQVNIKAEGDGPFEAQTAIIMTSDADTLARATAALVASGLPGEAVNTLVLPRDVIRFGFDEEADAVLLLGRLALGDDPEAEEAYVADIPMEVYRLTPATEGPALPVPPRTPRGDGITEDAYADALDALEEAVVTSFGEQTYAKVNIASAEVIAGILDPDTCIADVIECKGDNWDTTYTAGPLEVIRAGASLPLGPDDYFLAFGVNHTAAGKTTYCNMSVYASTKRIGVAAATNFDMAGSADAYLPDHPDRDKLFAYEVRRDCGDRPNCLDLPTEFPGVPLDESVFFIFRAYMNPGMAVGPDPSEVLAERVFVVRAPEIP